MKERKFILVGPANSGKTSWFSPFEGNYVIMFSSCKYIPAVSMCILTKIALFTQE